MLATIMMGGAVMTGLTATDNAAQGAVAALEEAGITNMPIITGQDNSPASQALIKSGKQTMTIDKNLKDMANNTAQPDHECADYRQPDRRRHSDHLL